jgi:hypothetical protein
MSLATLTIPYGGFITILTGSFVREKRREREREKRGRGVVDGHPHHRCKFQYHASSISLNEFSLTPTRSLSSLAMWTRERRGREEGEMRGRGRN